MPPLRNLSTSKLPLVPQLLFLHNNHKAGASISQFRLHPRRIRPYGLRTDRFTGPTSAVTNSYEGDRVNGAIARAAEGSPILP